MTVSITTNAATTVAAAVTTTTAISNTIVAVNTSTTTTALITAPVASFNIVEAVIHTIGTDAAVIFTAIPVSAATAGVVELRQTPENGLRSTRTVR